MTPSGAYLTTAMNSVSCHIWGAGAPAKTKKCGSPEGEYIFSGKGPTFPVSCKISKQQMSMLAGERELLQKTNKKHLKRRAQPWDWDV